MKKLIVSSLVTFAAVCGPAADWLYSGSTITEQGADGDPWVLNVAVVDAEAHSLKLGSGSASGNARNTVGDSTCLDVSGTITDANGVEYFITEINGSAFRGSTFASFVMPDTVTTIGGSAFRELTACTSVTLSKGLKTIAGYAFYQSNKLKTVEPLLPDSLESIDNCAFSLQSLTITGDLAIRNPAFTTLPTPGAGTAAPFSGCNFSTVDFSESGLTKLTTKVFASMSNLTDVKLPKTLETINYYWAFYKCTSLTNVTFQSLPTDLLTACSSSNDPFSGTTAFGVRFLYCPTLGDWDTFIAENKGGVVTLWDDIPENDLATKLSKTRYWARFGEGAPVPTGVIKVKGSTIWLVKYTVEVKTVNLQVTGNVLATADEGFDPVYGDYPDVQCPKTCVAPEYASLDGVAYARQGWTLEKSTDDGWVLVSSGLTGVCEFDQSESGTYRLTWQWAPHAYALDVGYLPASLGTCTVTPPNFGDIYYTNGTVVTATAVPAEGVSFVRWIGDVAEEDREKPSIFVTMDGKKSITPYLKGQWILDEANPKAMTVTDGYWTFAATGSREAITVGAVKTAGAVGLIDFSTGILGGGAFAGIGDSVFNGSAVLEECVMSDTMTSLGGSAFRNTTNLRRVVLSKYLTTMGGFAFNASSVSEIEPLLPKKLTAMGNCCFYNTPNLHCPLVMPAGTSGGIETAASRPDYGQFGGSKIPSYDLSRLSITQIGSHNFRGGSSITDVVFPATLTAIDGYAFYTGLKTPYTFVFTGGPVTIGENNALSTLGGRFVIDGATAAAAWQKYLAETEGCTVVKLTAAEKETYRTKFPGGPVAKYKVTMPNVPAQYLVYPGAGFSVIFR